MKTQLLSNLIDLELTDTADVITVLEDQTRVMGKRFEIGPDGKVKKTAAVSTSAAIAVQRHVPDVAALERILLSVSENSHQAVMNSYCPSLPLDTPYLILSDATLKNFGFDRDDPKLTWPVCIMDNGKSYPAIGRFKELLRPSRWILLDRDLDEHTPPELANQSYEEWLADLGRLLTGLLGCARLRAHSSSSRVSIGGKPIGTGNGHTWIQVSDQGDIARLSATLKSLAIKLGLAWQKPKLSAEGKVVASSLTTLIDLSVLNVGRIVFVGKPVVSGLFDPVAPQSIEVHASGGKLDTSKIQLPPPSEVADGAKRLGVDLTIQADGRVSHTEEDLRLDTDVVTVSGVQRLSDIMVGLAPGTKVRCDTPFRDSSSQAAFIAVNADGKPYLHDSGTSTTHWLRDADWNALKSAVNPERLSLAKPLFSPEEYRAARFCNGPAPAPKWLFIDFLPAGILALLVAQGGAGKSWLAMQLGAGVATGITVAGTWTVGQPGSVLMLCAEDDEDQLHRRFEKLLQNLAPRADAEQLTRIKEKLFIVPLVGSDNLLTATDPASREVKSTHTLDRLIAAAKKIPDLALIIVDPASRFRGGEENSAEDTTRFVQSLERLAAETGTTVLLIHHANKNAQNSKEASQSMSRGSSALVDGARWQLSLRTFTTDDAKSHGIAADDRYKYLRAELTKSNYTPPQPPIVLMRGDGGYLCHVEMSTTKTIRKDDLKSKILQLVPDELSAGRKYSKTAFADAFGGLDRALKAGNNTVRKTLESLLASGELQFDAAKKLCLRTKAKLDLKPL